MKLNHINIPVANVQETKIFYQTFFGLECIVQKGDDTFVGMRDEAGTTLAINNFRKVEGIILETISHRFLSGQPGQGGPDLKRLKEAGCEPEDPREEHGSYTFYLKAPAGWHCHVKPV